MSDEKTTGITEEQPSHDLALLATAQGGNGSADIVCRLGKDIIHRDRIVPAKAADRHRYVVAVLGKLGNQSAITEVMLNAEFLRIADRLDQQQSVDQPGSVADTDDASELPTTAVVRPELIIRNDISAIAIPIQRHSGSNIIGVWKHYLRSPNGRQCEPLSDHLEIVSGETIWLSPGCASPTPTDVKSYNRWSLDSREKWLAGAPAPTTAEVLRMVAEQIDRYIVLPSANATGHGVTLAAWVMMTYVYPALPAVPYVYLAGPPNSGKTRTMDVLQRLVFRPMMTGNVTAATIFRTRHAYGGVMLLDEAERMGDSGSSDVQEIRSILLSGYRRGGTAVRMEPHGDTFRAVTFDCYGPVVLGAIRGLPPALASRCITVRLQRASKGDPQSRRSLDDSPEAATEVLDALHCWALEYGHAAIANAPPPNALANRDAELWGPLLSIVEHADDSTILQMLIDHAETQSAIAADDATPQADGVFLMALRNLLVQGLRPTAGEVLNMSRLIDADVVDSIWSAKGVASVLKRYDLRTCKTNGRRVFKIEPAVVVAIAERYSFDLGSEVQP